MTRGAMIRAQPASALRNAEHTTAEIEITSDAA
jgi:hypothetical protein